MDCLSNLFSFKNNCAIILCDKNGILNFKNYNYVNDIFNCLKSCLEPIKTKNICIGLYMSQNIYLPFIIASLNKLGFTFTFLTEKNIEIITALKITWILSITPLHGIENFTKFHETEINQQDSIILWKSNLEISDIVYKNIFCVVGSSGTTGHHKIIKVTNKCIENNATCLRTKFSITSNDFIYWGTPLTFDPSLIELLITVQVGACLVIVSEKTRLNPNYLYQALFNVKSEYYRGITFLQMVPSVFFHWNDEHIKSILHSSNLKVLAFGGEQFPLNILKYPKNHNLQLFNLYGITEVSCWATIYHVKDDDVEIPIGSVLDDTVVEIRNDLDEEIIDGEGEIVIGSQTRICLINDETFEGTVQKKIIFRKTGDLGKISNEQIFYIGRKNRTIKRYGHKIHLDKIEQTIFKETQLQNKCVWSKSHKKLLLFICLNETNSTVKKKILDKLQVKLLHSLPPEFLPDYSEIVMKFPVTSHGKLDENFLESVYSNSLQIDRNLSVVEEFSFLLCKYFGLNLIELNKLKTHTFFEIGGNSILAIQLLTEFKEKTNLDYPPELLQHLFENSIEHCLNCLENCKMNSGNYKIKIHPNNKRVKIQEERGIDFKIIWSYDLKACVDASPIAFEFNNKIFIAVGSFSKFFVILDENSEIYFEQIMPDVIESSPDVTENGQFVFFGCFDGNLYCVDMMLKTVIWEYSTEDRIKCSPTICRNYSAVLIGSYDKHLHCVNIADGKLIWKTNLSGSIVAKTLYDELNKVIYAATIFGTCFCLNAIGEIKWKFQVSSPIFGSPSFLNLNCTHIIFPEVKGTIHCISSAGLICWTFQTENCIYSSIKQYENKIIFSCKNGSVFVVQVSESECRMVNEICLNSPVSSTPFLYEMDQQVVLISASDLGFIYCVDLKTGVVFGSTRLPGDIFSSPFVCNGRVYVGCRNNNLYSLKICDIRK